MNQIDLENVQEKQKKIFSISELTRSIRKTLETSFSHVWIEGEISNFIHHSSGHMYLSLKDETSQIQAVIFRNVNQKIRFEIKDGLKVLVLAKVTVYEKRGQYQLVVEKIEPKGIGALELALRQLTEKLRKEGLFNPEHKKPLPFLPERIGVITSPTGAVIRDILNVSQRRFPSIPILLFPVKVQGEGAREEIAAAIEAMNRHKLCDVLIVGRGGGSLEDLWAFNEEIVARTIFASQIPIVSAVGHEVDVTISDLVADQRASTPSVAAELVVPNRAELESRTNQSRERIRLAINNYLADLKERVLNAKESYALTQPGRIIEQARQRLDELMRQMENYQESLMEDKKADLKRLAAQLQALSPLAVLSRGYSLTLNEKGKVLRSSEKIKKDDLILTQLGRGVIESKVLTVDSKKKILG